MSLSIWGSSGFLQAQQAMFAKLDLNTDGALSADEFTAIGQNMPPQEGARQLKGGGGFQGFSAETLSALMGVQQTSHADRAAEIFAGADADGDGSLTAEELSADMAAHAPPGAAGTDSASRAADMLSAADTNKDGTVSMSELLASLQSSNEVAAGFSSEVSDLMSKLLEKLQADVASSTESVTA